MLRYWAIFVCIKGAVARFFRDFEGLLQGTIVDREGAETMAKKCSGKVLCEVSVNFWPFWHRGPTIYVWLQQIVQSCCCECTFEL